MKKRSIAILLAALMLLAVCSCADNKSDVSNAAPEVSVDEGFYGYTIANPEGYGGKTVTFLTTYANDSYQAQISPKTQDNFDEEKASSVMTAIVERTNIVEQALNVKIVEEVVLSWNRTGGGPMYDAVRNDITSGDLRYDVIMPCTRDAAKLAREGILLDLKTEVPGFDPDNEWWSKRYNEDTAIDGKLFFTIGDIGYVNKDATLFVAFNKQMVEDCHLLDDTGYKSLYEMVDKKAWTQDVMLRMSKEVYLDNNGNGKCDPGDRNGIAGQCSLIQWMLFASGERIASLDSDRLPTITLGTGRAVSVIESVQDYILDPKNGYLSANDYFNISNVPVAEVTVPEFINDRCLFFIDAILNMENIRGMSSDFGVLPMPLYDETQENYSSSIGYWTADAVAIHNGYSKDTERLKMVADVLEAMGAVSRKHVVPVYYQKTLQTQIARDEESERMLDIIFENRTIDLADVYNWGELSSLIATDMYSAPKGSFIGKFSEIRDPAEVAINETIEDFKKLDK